MSRKNNLSKRKNQSEFDKRREEELKAQQDRKRLTKQLNREVRATGADEAMAEAAPVAAVKPRLAGRVAKKNRGFRIKKGTMVMGVKIKDGDSKAEALRRLSRKPAKAAKGDNSRLKQLKAEQAQAIALMEE